MYIFAKLLEIIHKFYLLQKAKSVWIIYRLRYLLSISTKLSLYYIIIFPYLSYCNIVWSSTYNTHLNRIYLLHKSAIRALTNSEYRPHTSPLFAKRKTLDIFGISTFHGWVARSMVSANHWLRGIKTYRLLWFLTRVSANHASSNWAHVAKFMFCYHHDMPPSSFINLFTTGGQLHTHATRFEKQLQTKLLSKKYFNILVKTVYYFKLGSKNVEFPCIIRLKLHRFC